MLITKEYIRSVLGVSKATISNWIRTGQMPDYPEGNNGYTTSTFHNILAQIESTNKLTSRVNRSFNQERQIVTGTLSYAESKLLVEWLVSLLQRYELSVEELMLTLSIKALSEQELIDFDWDTGLIQCENPEFSSFLEEWIGERTLEPIYELYIDLQGLKIPDTEPDFMGVVYESMRTVGEKSRLGAFFTPAYLIEDIEVEPNATVLDPCSGTGTILLHVLGRDHEPDLIHLRDIDALALRVAKVNFALFFKRIDKLIHTDWEDIFTPPRKERFDYIITNPPWGARLDKKAKKQLLKDYPELNSSESFSIALYNSLQKLKRNTVKGNRLPSRLIFILPESLLYVDAHENIRKVLFEGPYKTKVEHFGKAFKGVMSKVIRIEVQRGKTELTVVKDEDQAYNMPMSLLEMNNYRPAAVNHAAELPILEKIFAQSHFSLEERSTFGLGIVTGNNKLHLKNKQEAGAEPIYTGKNLSPFQFDEPTKFIQFDPSKLQQVAKVELYRQPKLCYRFISNKLMVVADFKGALLLNSINFFIPEGLSLKALCAFLNAPVSTYLYQRLFNSIKVLRKHLEALPIPANFAEYEAALEALHDKAVEGEDYEDSLHQITCEMYGLDELEAKVVLQAEKPI
jgi:predicted RNA methylase